MKTSIFDMNFTLPPVVEMTEVVKDMPNGRMTFIFVCTVKNCSI
jgi:hypothetical protein